MCSFAANASLVEYLSTETELRLECRLLTSEKLLSGAAAGVAQMSAAGSQPVARKPAVSP